MSRQLSCEEVQHVCVLYPEGCDRDCQHRDTCSGIVWAKEGEPELPQGIIICKGDPVTRAHRQYLKDGKTDWVAVLHAWEPRRKRLLTKACYRLCVNNAERNGDQSMARHFQEILDKMDADPCWDPDNQKDTYGY